MINTFKKKSLNRIFQEIFAKRFFIGGKIIEFGASKESKKNFTNFVNISEKSSLVFCDKQSNDEKVSLKEDLEKRLSFEDNYYDSILIFNVLEHIFDSDNAISEINRCLKIKGKLIGSVPFIHRVHGAPEDFNRYTSQFLEKLLKKYNFVNIEIQSYGYGPCTACYAIIFDFTKMVPFLNNILLCLSILMDKFINIFVKTDLREIYPIALSFYGEKK